MDGSDIYLYFFGSFYVVLLIGLFLVVVSIRNGKS